MVGLRERIESHAARVAVMGQGYVGLPLAIEFAKAAAMRPRIVGEGLQQIARDPEIFHALFNILEAQKIVEGEVDITLVPAGNELLNQLAATSEK